MANENELQIVLTLIDNASAELKKITGEVKKDTDDIKKKSDEASKSLKDGFKDAGKELKDFRRAAFAVTAEIAFIGAAVKAWGDHNLETRDSLNKLATNGKSLFAMFGSIFAPAINALSAVIQQNMGFLAGLFTTVQKGYTWLFEKISFGTQYLIAFNSAMQHGATRAQAHADALKIAGNAVDEMSNKFKAAFVENIPQVDAMKTQLKETNEALDKINIQYLTGAISAQQYYVALTSGENAQFQNMQMNAQFIQQASAQEIFLRDTNLQAMQQELQMRKQIFTEINLMSNQRLLDERTNTDASIGLLRTLQQYHHTAYSTMMDFTNMFITKMSTGMSSAITSIIMGTKKATEAFREFGTAMITAIVEFIIQYGIQMLIGMALSRVVMASVSAQAAGLAFSWYPAAFLAAVATNGEAVAAGGAALGVGSGAAAALTASMVGASQAMGSGFSFGGGATGGTGAGGGYASGGWAGLNGPEVAMLGERGPEYIVPNNRLGNMGNQTSIHIEINNPIVRSDEDIDRLTEEISLRLAREAERL